MVAVQFQLRLFSFGAFLGGLPQIDIGGSTYINLGVLPYFYLNHGICFDMFLEFIYDGIKFNVGEIKLVNTVRRGEIKWGKTAQPMKQPKKAEF